MTFIICACWVASRNEHIPNQNPLLLYAIYPGFVLEPCACIVCVCRARVTLLNRTGKLIRPNHIETMPMPSSWYVFSVSTNLHNSGISLTLSEHIRIVEPSSTNVIKIRAMSVHERISFSGHTKRMQQINSGIQVTCMHDGAAGSSNQNTQLKMDFSLMLK